MSGSQANGIDDPGEARCIVSQCKAFGEKIARLAASWLILGDDGELVLKRFELGRPVRPSSAAPWTNRSVARFRLAGRRHQSR